MGKDTAKNFLYFVLAFVVLGGAIYGGIKYFGQSGVNPGATHSDNLNANGCPSNGLTSFILNVWNKLNTTGSENFDVTAYLFKNGAKDATITDTTNPSATNIECGKHYIMKVISTDGNGGDSGKFIAASGCNGATVDSDGNIEFDATSSTCNIDAYGKQHGVLEFRVKDNLNNGYMYNSTQADTTTYHLSGESFTSTTSNTTNTSVNAGKKLDLNVDFETTVADTDFNDFGTYVLLDAPTTTWDVASTMSLSSGDSIVESKGALTATESRAYSTYEQVYKFNAAVKNSVNTLHIVLSALSGVDPVASTDDVTIAFASIGSYLSTDGSQVKVGATKDDSGATAVYTIQTAKVKVA